jgi:hypothetical protein
MLAHPFHQITHIGIAPHPAREAGKAGERLFRTLVATLAAHVLVHAKRVGPIPFDHHRGKTFLFDEALRDAHALAVKLVSAVGGFAQHDDAGIADLLHQRVVVFTLARQRLHRTAKRFDDTVSSRQRRCPVAA